MARKNNTNKSNQRVTKKKQSPAKISSTKTTTNKKNAPSKQKQQRSSGGSSCSKNNKRFVICPYTEQKVFVAQATLSDLKSPDTYKNSGKGNASKKRLWTIPSLQQRQDHYVQVAKALALAEQQRLPSSGGRSWEVEAKVTEPNGRILFRAWKGKMELAVLPHLIDRIPPPPIWQGKRHQPKDEFYAFQDEVLDSEHDYITALSSREISTLSHVAYDILKKHPYNHPIPTISLKWISPDARSFQSRKAAWDYAQQLCEQEVLINRNLLGIGASGKLLQAFTPPLKTTVEVLGPLRFVRDGLWVVGQELSWQDGRGEQIIRQTAEQRERQSQRVFTTGLQLYVATHRVDYRNEEENECSTLAQADKELRVLWHQMSSKEQQIWHNKVSGEQIVDDDDDDDDAGSTENDDEKDYEDGGDGATTTSHDEGTEGCAETDDAADDDEGEQKAPVVLSRMKYFVFMRRDQYRLEREKEMDSKVETQIGDSAQEQPRRRRRLRFTLGQADKELRERWKAMTEVEQDEWIDKLVNGSSLEAVEVGDEEKEEVAGYGQDSSSEEENMKEICTGGAIHIASRRSSLVFDVEMAEGLSHSKGTEDNTEICEIVDVGVITEGRPATQTTTATTSIDVVENDTSVVLSNENLNKNDEHSTSDSGLSSMPINTLSRDDTLERTNKRMNAVSPTKDDDEEYPSEVSSSTTATASNEEVVAETIRSTESPDDDPNLTFFIVKPGGAKITTIKSTISDTSSSNDDIVVESSTKKRPTRIQKQPTSRVTQRWCLNQQQIDQCHTACMEHYESVMRTVKTRDLLRQLEVGFDVLRERGRGRFDMNLPAFDTPDFDFLNDFTKTPWMPVVHAILGEDVVLIHKGCFISLPGAGSQEYHQDGVHLTTQTQRPCHAINVFVPLVDLTNRNGPTEFCLGSHVLGHEGYDRDFVEVPKPKAGTPVIFDYRLGHRGLANSSTTCRPIVYCTYARAADGKEFRDLVNFSRKRYHKIGELAHKPMSREERSNKRKRKIESSTQQMAQQPPPPNITEVDDRLGTLAAATTTTTEGLMKPTQQETDGTVSPEVTQTETQTV